MGARGVFWGLILIGATALFLAGIAVGASRVFPYPQLSALKTVVLGDSDTPAQPVPDRAMGRTLLFPAFSPDVEVVMVGDSITEGAIWAEVFPGVSIANRGVWADTTADVLSRMDTIASVAPEKAFVMLGINDIAAGLAVADIVANYTEIVGALRAAGARVYIQSTLICRLPLCRERQDDVETLNARLAALADREGHVFIDLNASMTVPETGLLRPDFTYDGIHLSGTGYAHWANRLDRYIRPSGDR